MVDRPETRHVERGLRDLPGEAPAEHEVGLAGAQERLDRMLVAREEEIEAGWGGGVAQLELGRRGAGSRRRGASSATGSCPSSRTAPTSALAIGAIVQMPTMRQLCTITARLEHPQCHHPAHFGRSDADRRAMIRDTLMAGRWPGHSGCTSRCSSRSSLAARWPAPSTSTTRRAGMRAATRRRTPSSPRDGRRAARQLRRAAQGHGRRARRESTDREGLRPPRGLHALVRGHRRPRQGPYRHHRRGRKGHVLVQEAEDDAPECRLREVGLAPRRSHRAVFLAPVRDDMVGGAGRDRLITDSRRQGSSWRPSPTSLHSDGHLARSTEAVAGPIPRRYRRPQHGRRALEAGTKVDRDALAAGHVSSKPGSVVARLDWREQVLRPHAAPKAGWNIYVGEESRPCWPRSLGSARGS